MAPALATEVRWSTPADLADELGVSLSTVSRLCTSRRIPHHRIGSQVRFSPEDLDAIRQQTFVAPAT